MSNKQTTGWIAALILAVLTLGSTLSQAQSKDRDTNPPGSWGGPGTNWENPPGPQGGTGASPDRRDKDKDNNPPGSWGGPGTNWENRPGPQGGPGTSPNR